MSTTFMSAQTLDGRGEPQGIFQPILAHNWYGNDKDRNGKTMGYHPNYSASVFDCAYGDHTIISGPVLDGIKPGDIIEATISYHQDEQKWTASITHTDGSGKPHTTYLTKKYTQLNPKDVVLDIAYEAYLKADRGKGGLSRTHV